MNKRGPANVPANVQDSLGLRQRALEVSTKAGENFVDTSADPKIVDVDSLLHELQVHQIELEIQNEELRTARNTLEASRARYIDLYDLAPVGYCSVNLSGMIVQANLTLATMLNTTRAAITALPAFANYVYQSDQHRWYDMFRLLQKGEIQKTCELRLRKAATSPASALIDEPNELVWAQLVAKVAQDEAGANLIHMAISDISILKLAQTELSESEARWKFAIEGLGDGLWEWNIQTDKAFYSPRFKELLGLYASDTQISLAELSRRIHTSDLTQAKEALQDCLKGKADHASVELRVSQHGSGWMWIMARSLVVERDTLGKPIRLVGTISDISARKQAEQSERFRSHTTSLLAANEPLPVLLENIVLGIEHIHPAMLCSIALIDSDGLRLGKNVAPSLPAAYNAVMNGLEIGIGAGSCGTAASTGERVIVEDIASHEYWNLYREPAASAGLRACWSQPIKNASGDVLGTFTVYHRMPKLPAQADIELMEEAANLTSIAIERHQAHTKLQLAASVFHHSREALMITDIKGTILEVNEAFVRTTGYSFEDVIGQTPRVWHSGMQDAAFYAAMWSALHAQGYWSGEVWNRRKNGEVFAALLTISAVRDIHDKTRWYVALASDINERKRSEAAMLQLNLALEEKRNQLRRLAAQNEAVREEERKHIAREVHDELGQILTALRMDTSFIAMRFGRLDSELNAKSLEMRAQVDQAILGVRNVATNLRPMALDMGILLALDWLSQDFTKHTGVPCTLNANDKDLLLDESRSIVIFRIVQESLTNISRYAHASQVLITLHVDKDYLTVEVRDNGIGFDPKASDVSKRFGILGMKERALVLGGRLNVVSSPGKGTKIVLIVPIESDEASE